MREAMRPSLISKRVAVVIITGWAYPRVWWDGLPAGQMRV